MLAWESPNAKWRLATHHISKPHKLDKYIIIRLFAHPVKLTLLIKINLLTTLPHSQNRFPHITIVQ
jgi:hypothetical protein